MNSKHQRHYSVAHAYNSPLATYTHSTSPLSTPYSLTPLPVEDMVDVEDNDTCNE